DAGGLFHPFWIDNRTGLPQIWTAQVAVNASAEKFGDPALNSYTDVSGDVFLILGDARWDRSSSQVSFAATIRNTSKKAIYGPLKVRITGMRSQLADSVDYSGDSPVVDFTGTIPGGALRPGQTTAPKRL